MLVVDGSGIPIGFHLDSASKAEVRSAESTLRSIRVPRSGRGRPRTRPTLLTADRAYDSRDFRRYLRRRGIRACIPPR
ncbi:MAG: transposase [Gemmatimonadota bacterium]|nr:transposase [Gemmatimonadota bacterium]